jgi:hypothetical protein
LLTSDGVLFAPAGSTLQAGSQQAQQDHWLMWEASVLRPATYSSSTAEPLAVLEAALSKSSSGLLLGPSLSLADVSELFMHATAIVAVQLAVGQ